jgi:hypothetical protein
MSSPRERGVWFFKGAYRSDHVRAELFTRPRDVQILGRCAATALGLITEYPDSDSKSRRRYSFPWARFRR